MLNKLTSGLFFLILIELILGGGRLISISPISLRMILFALAIVITAIHLLSGSRIDRKHLILLLIFTGMLGIGIATGLVSGADKKLIWEDVKPQLFFYLLPFFSFAITTETDLKKISRTIIVSSCIMAFVFLVMLLLIVTNTLPFLDFYNVAYPTGEFFFRGEYSFFYKGFIYLCIGLIFVHLQRGMSQWWLMGLLLLAILLTFTRGLVFALGLVYLVYYTFRKQFTKAIFAGLVCGIVLFFGKDIYGLISEQLYQIRENASKETTEAATPQAIETVNNPTTEIIQPITEGNENIESKSDLPPRTDNLLGDREFSDNERKIQIKQVIDSLTWTSIVWGHGFGNGVAIRPIHMEISYLEIFHKQGIIGLACWAFICFTLLIHYQKALPVDPKVANAFFLSALFVFCQSWTNQYVNNPIGLGMVLIAIVSLETMVKNLSKDELVI